MILLLKLIFKNNWKKIGIITILSFILVQCQIFVIGNASIILILVKNNALDEFVPMLYRIGIVIIIASLISLIISYISVSIASNSAYQIKKELFNILMEANNFDDFNKVNFSGLMSRTIRGVETIQSFVLILLRRVLILIMASIVVVFELYNLDPSFAITFLIFLIVMTLIFLYKLNSLANIYFKVKRINGKINKSFREKILTLKLIKIFSNKNDSNNIFKKIIDESYDKGHRFQYKLNYIYSFMMFIHIFILFLVLLCLTAFHIDKSEGLNIFIMLLYLVFWANKFDSILPLVSIYSLAYTSATRIEEVLYLKDKYHYFSNPQKENEFEGIEFNNISLSISNRKILSNISIKIPKNSKTLIVGPIASGKTTLIYSLMGFHKIDSGKILIDGVNINSTNLNGKISFTPEKSYLLKKSIFENIKLSDDSISLDDVRKICNDVLFEKELSFEVNEYGNNLTNESKQKLAIVRALAHDSDYYIFDNSFSYIKLDTKHIIKENIKKRLENKTLIFVGNDFDECYQMDNIVVLDKGFVVASGKHDDLIKTCEIYKKLYNEYGGKSNV